MDFSVVASKGVGFFIKVDVVFGGGFPRAAPFINFWNRGVGGVGAHHPQDRVHVYNVG